MVVNPPSESLTPRWFSIRRARIFLLTTLSVLLGMSFYVLLGLWIAPSVQVLYEGSTNVVFAPTHFNDARQYVMICVQGYDVAYSTLPTLTRSRINWMPVYAVLQCAAHQIGHLSLIYTSWAISTLAIGLVLLAGIGTLRNLQVRLPLLSIWAVLFPLIGGAWLYLASVEATYLAVGMVVMWLITLPLPRYAVGELARVVGGVALGCTFFLTKPNALAFLLPLTFAFVYQSWRYSQQIGYAGGFWTFAADVVIEHVRPLLAPLLSRIGTRFKVTVTLDPCPIVYAWAPLAVGAGVIVGLAYWLMFTSRLSGVPLYFLQQQTTVWGRAWPSGNVQQMVYYFAQAFYRLQPFGGIPPWRMNAAWNLAANVSALIPAASRRVPGLVRGMLPLVLIFLLYSGAVHGSDRYILSTALVAIGWACWLSPAISTKPVKARTRFIWGALRWLFVLSLFGITAALLLNQMLPIGEPNAWGVLDFS